VKRTAVEGRTRGSVILGFRESITAMGIVARQDAGIVRAEDLADVPVAVQEHTGSHYMAIKMLEGSSASARSRPCTWAGRWRGCRRCWTAG
jgi:hypothetical protein